ncbi:type VI secretion system tube protein Hcp [Paenibacillus sp. PR3]|uniref:Type VI secretion system tube protein Hcp n=1 Tax=Paenibacillus terricola TaxID=2763503 RepID=A0ABR8MWL4_9BACL|nr:type VI secretion system tube protein Hcp [Paenibacillus terricola]MBD3920366.1 type VI secretion system tube protein Hcp [Paenibacillus terricola]
MRKSLLSILAALVFALTLSVVPASASATDKGYDVFMQLDGITGEVTNKNYEKWIGLTSVAFQLSGDYTGFGAGSGAGKSHFDSFEINKLFDASSISILLAALKGKHIPKGKIVFTRTLVGGERLPFLTFEFNDILVSSYDFNDTDETISLQFGQIKWTYTSYDAKGKPSTTQSGGWDIKTNTAI